MYSTNNPIDENTFYLQQHEHKQDLLEKEHMSSLEDKYDEVLEYADSIMQGLCEDDIFNMAFYEYYEDDRGDYNPYIMATLEAWYCMEVDKEDHEVLHALALRALRTACVVICDDNLENVAFDGNWVVKDMVKELLGEV